MSDINHTYLNQTTRDWLSSHVSGTVKFDEPMSGHTSLKVGGPAEAYVQPGDIEDLMMVIEWSVENRIPFMVIGNGTNLLVTDKGIPGIVIVLNKCLKSIRKAGEQSDHTLVNAMAGAKLQTLCRYGIRQGLAGLNFALGIPGTVGGGVRMNAGTALGSMSDVLTAVTVLMSDGEMKRLRRETLHFSYRRLTFEDTDSGDPPIILDGCFRLRKSASDTLQREAEEILSNRKKREPLTYPNAGCFFKNPSPECPAGRLIDEAGLKGRKIGGAQVAEKHANYIVNRGNASADDILTLMSLIQETVRQQHNIDLVPEVKIVGTC